MEEFDNKFVASVQVSSQMLEAAVDIKRETNATSVEEVLKDALTLYSLVTHRSCKEVRIQITRTNGKKDYFTLKELLQAKKDNQWTSFHCLPLPPRDRKIK